MRCACCVVFDAQCETSSAATPRQTRSTALHPHVIAHCPPPSMSLAPGRDEELYSPFAGPSAADPLSPLSAAGTRRDGSVPERVRPPGAWHTQSTHVSHTSLRCPYLLMSAACQHN